MDLGDAEYEYGLFSFAIIRTYN